MSKERKFKDGVNLIPGPSFPSGASEGTLFSSDGTLVDKGLYQLIDGDWIKIGGSEDVPGEIVVENKNFEVDTLNWTFTPAVGATGGGISRNLIDPIAGIADLRVEPTSSGLSTGNETPDSNPTIYDILSTTFSLDDKVERETKLKVEFDLLREAYAGSVPPLFIPAHIFVEIYDADNAGAVETRPLIFQEVPGNPPAQESLFKASLEFNSTFSTNYELRLLFSNDGTYIPVYRIDNVRINTRLVDVLGKGDSPDYALAEYNNTDPLVSIPSGSGFSSPIPFRISDSNNVDHGLLSTLGEFHIKSDGLYNISSALELSTVTPTNPSGFRFHVFVNGNKSKVLEAFVTPSGVPITADLMGTTSLRLNLGDIVTIRVQQNSGATLNLNTAIATDTPLNNWATITKVGE